MASKGAVIALTRSMAREVGPLGIRVNVIAPGFTLTEASRELFAEEGRDPETYALDRGSLKRPAQPEDVVGAALWLAGEGAGYVTGQTIVVDGGRIFVWSRLARRHAVRRPERAAEVRGLTNPQRVAMSRIESSRGADRQLPRQRSRRRSRIDSATVASPPRRAGRGGGGR